MTYKNKKYQYKTKINTAQFVILTLLFILLININAKSQAVLVSATLENNNLKIGDKTMLTIQVVQKSGLKINIPKFADRDTIINEIEISKSFPADTSINGDKLIIVKKLKIQAFESDTIPSFIFTMKTGERIDTLRSNELYITVSPQGLVQPADSAMIYDIKPPIDAPITTDEVTYYVKQFMLYKFPFFLLAYLVLGGIAFLIKKYTATEKFELVKKKPKELPSIIAIRHLDELRDKQQQLLQQEKYKKYHSELTSIIRTYIEDRYSINAMEQTSEEILQSFRHSMMLGTQDFEKLQQLLSLADFVKFAKLKPLPEENELSIKNAYTFVTSTKQKKTEKKVDEK